VGSLRPDQGHRCERVEAAQNPKKDHTGENKHNIGIVPGLVARWRA